MVGHHEQCIEELERELKNKTSYIKLVEIKLVELSSKVERMENHLCWCGQDALMQEEEPAVEDGGLEYTSESEYYTPPIASQLMIEGPIPIMLVGKLEIHSVRFGTLEEVVTSVVEGVLEEEGESSEGEDVEEFIVLVG